MSDDRYQRCVECDNKTGRCAEDAIYVGNVGPLCEDCRQKYRCGDCEGEGERNVFRNSRGEVDYVGGDWTDELVKCETCGGEGYY